MSEEAPVQAPTDIAGVGIHLSYIRRDMKELKDALTNITSNYVPITLFIDLKTEVEHLKIENEKRKEFQDTLTGKMIAMGTISGLIISGVTILITHYWK